MSLSQAHLLPEHLRSFYTRANARFLHRIKEGACVRTSTLYVSLSAILQSSVRASRPAHESPALAALLADVVPEFRQEPNEFVTASASTPEIALIARFDDRHRSARDRLGYRPECNDYRPERSAYRPDIRRDPRPQVRRDFRPDDRSESRPDLRGPARGASRPESRAAADDPPDSSATLEDLQKSFASLQSQLDKHSRQARQALDTSSSRRDRAAFAAHADDSAEASYAAYVMDRPDAASREHEFYSRPLAVRTTIDSD